MSNRILTREEFAVMQEAVAYKPAESHCPLMPLEGHCWHEVSVFWDGLFPPPLICCWCAAETFDMGAVPHRHGPHAPDQ